MRKRESSSHIKDLFKTVRLDEVKAEVQACWKCLAGGWEVEPFLSFKLPHTRVQGTSLVRSLFDQEQ
jgi:hypothetical protein